MSAPEPRDIAAHMGAVDTASEQRALVPAGKVFDDSSDDSAKHSCRGAGGEATPHDSSYTARPEGLTSSTREASDVTSSSSTGRAAPASEFAAGPRSSPRTLGGGEAATVAEGGEGDLAEEQRTTVVIQGISPGLDRESVARLLDGLGFGGRHDAVHVPHNNGAKLHMCTAFVNFLGPEDAAQCIRRCTGRPFGDWDGDVLCNVQYANVQGAAFTLSQAARAGGGSRSHRRRVKQGRNRQRQPSSDGL
mmetsp:Transcript_133064/g.384909  ORF Transcript_133064/g.384909 Transcript_133064/m.384909 type:complete len:248 (-) Transcript_133064:77-820(-)